jgi:integrase
MPNEKSRTGRSERGTGSVFQRKDGRWVATVDFGKIDGKRVRKVRYAGSEREAYKLLHELQNDKDFGLVNSSESLTVGQFLKTWIEEIHGQKLSYLSRLKYKAEIRLRLVPHLGTIRLKQLQPLQIHQALQRMLKTGLSAASVRYTFSVLRAALTTAHRYNMIRQNPATAVEPVKGQPPKEKTALTEERVQQLLAVLAPHRLFALFYLGLYTGMRKGEMLALRWQDIDLAGQKIHVRHSLYRENGVFKLKEPKSRSGRRIIPIPAQLVEVLAMHQARQEQERQWEEGRWEEYGFVFTTRRGRPLDGSNVYHQFTEAQKEAGLTPVSVHELRHTYGTNLANLGISPSNLKGLMGHSQASLTMNHYTHLTEPAADEAAKRLEQQIDRMAVSVAVNSQKEKRPKPLTN